MILFTMALFAILVSDMPSLELNDIYDILFVLVVATLNTYCANAAGEVKHLYMKSMYKRKIF